MAQSLAEAVDCARHGNQAAWEQLFYRYEGVLRWIGSGFRLNRDQVADAAQTTWLQLVREIRNLRDPEKLGGWLCVTMRRECIRLASRQDREELRDEWRADELAVDGYVEAQVLRAERDDLLWQAVDRLPERQRDLVLALLTTPPPSYQDVARRLSMPIGSIGPTRGRCLDRLRRLAHL